MDDSLCFDVEAVVFKQQAVPLAQRVVVEVETRVFLEVGRAQQLSGLATLVFGKRAGEAAARQATTVQHRGTAPFFGQFAHRVIEVAALSIKILIFGLELPEIGITALFAFVDDLADFFHAGIDRVNSGSCFFGQRRGRQPDSIDAHFAARLP